MKNLNNTFIFLTIFFLSVNLSMAQNVGIGTTSPSEKLEVVGNVKADTVKSSVLQISSGIGEGKVLTSDAMGNGVWQSPDLQLQDILFKHGQTGDGPSAINSWHIFNSYETVTVDSGQTVVAYCQAGLGKDDIGSSTFRIDVVYQDNAGGNVFNMAENGYINIDPNFENGERKHFSVFGRKTFNTAGTYRIGMGAYSNQANYLDNNEWQNIMIMIYD